MPTSGGRSGYWSSHHRIRRSRFVLRLCAFSRLKATLTRPQESLDDARHVCSCHIASGQPRYGSGSGRALDSKLIEIGTTLAQWDALRAIDRHPESSSHKLAGLTFQTDQSFGALANRMV